MKVFDCKTVNIALETIFSCVEFKPKVWKIVQERIGVIILHTIISLCFSTFFFLDNNYEIDHNVFTARSFLQSYNLSGSLGAVTKSTLYTEQ